MHGVARRGMGFTAGHGKAGHGVARRGKARHGFLGRAGQGEARSGAARSGEARRGFHGEVRLGAARPGEARPGAAWRGFHGWARRGFQGKARPGAARQGKARQGRARQGEGFTAWPGSAWLGMARRGLARHGKAWVLLFSKTEIFRMRQVFTIDGHRVIRPAKDHPNPAQWEKLKAERRSIQTHDNEVLCGTCWVTESETGTFDLHHKHYDHFGRERIEDLVLLCRPCHEAITSRIRAERFARGDRTAGIDLPVATPDDRYRPVRAGPVVAATEPKPCDFQPKFKPINSRSSNVSKI